MSKSSWTDERISTLSKLWGEGKTASQIADLLGGVTRNAVIGKAHRLKLNKRASPIQTNRKQKANPQIDLPTNVTTGKGISLLELKERSCRWPNGDPKKESFNFCGLGAVPGLPYCGEHAAVAYQGSNKKFNVHIAENIDDVDVEKIVGEQS
jgi:GcrA cell cycle regulator